LRHLRRKQVRATYGDAAGLSVHLPFGEVDLGAAADPKAETGKQGISVEDLAAGSEWNVVNGAAGET
jgi:hypothetical protein